MLMALTALSIDIMLPALAEISREYNLTNPNHRQYVVLLYFVGLGFGQIVFGALSDRLGRRPVMLFGLGIYIGASFLALWAPDYTWLLGARVVQGFGGAAPRTVLIASVRDLFEGRAMARVMSMVMMVFLAVPVVAPAIGQVLQSLFNWKAPFYFLLVFGVVAFLWAMMRFPETRPRNPDPSQRTQIRDALRGVMTNRQTMTYLFASGLLLGCLTSFIASSQQIFVEIYNLGYWFPLAFAGGAVAMILANATNTRIVMRLGARTVSHTAIAFLMASACAFTALQFIVPQPPVLLTWAALSWMMYLFGLISQNMNALAMEPQGEVAGMAASILGTYTTLCGVFVGWIIAGAFDGTIFPISLGFALLSTGAILTIVIGEGQFYALRRERDA